MNQIYHILHRLQQTLYNLEDGAEGNLFGVKNGTNITFLTSTNGTTSNEAENHLPGGIKCYGKYVCSINGGLMPTSDNHVLVSVDISSKIISVYFENKSVPINVIDKLNIFGEFMLCPIKYNMGTFAFEKNQKELLKTLTIIKNKIEGNNRICLKSGKQRFLRIDDKRLIKDCLEIKGKTPCTIRNIRKQKFDILLNVSGDSELANIMTLNIDPVSLIQFPVAFDTLTLISVNATIGELLLEVQNSLQRCYKLLEEQLLKEMLANKFSQLEIFHFLPSEEYFLTTCYPKNARDDDLVEDRRKLHKLFGLPEDRPLLRRCNAYSVDLDPSADVGFTGLLNPHEGLNASGVPDGSPAVVQGQYAYYHYLQQGMQDSGWGCAYRSLQTICSWFRIQGYTNRTEPTHKDIQKCLVDIKDKPSSFIGSSQWIGSTEVSFVLDTLYGIECRIISVSSGEELSTKGGELTHHFRNQGTPIMIGGGQLAHTILGVDYNRKTGAIKFLILDPHYTGQDILDTVLNKGWCGWKGPDFWKKNCFYNMCLPQRPKCL